MANRLKPTIRAYLHFDDTDKRYVRLDEMAGKLEFNIDDVKVLAVAAGASYKLYMVSETLEQSLVRLQCLL